MSKVVKFILFMTLFTLMNQIGCNQRATEPDRTSPDFRFLFQYGQGIHESPISLLQNSGPDDLKKVNFLQTIDEARVLVLDISEYPSGWEFESSAQFDRYHEDWNHFTGDRSSWNDWNGLLGKHFNIVSNVELTIDSSNARGKASGAIGLNRVIVALIERGVVRYHGVADATGVEDETSEVNVYVSPWYYSNVAKLQVTPVSVTLGAGQTQQFTCTATYLDSSKGDVTAQSTWSTSPGSAGNISSTGLFTADSVVSGIETVTATYSGYQAQAQVTVSGGGGGSGTLVRIDVVPDSVILGKGGSQQFTCMATYDDSSTANVSNLATWSTTPGTAGSISSSGLFTAHSTNTGTEIVTADYQGFNDQGIVNVTGGGTQFTVIRTIDLEQAPKDPLITPDGSSVYVPCMFANKVYVISTSSNSVLATVDVSDYSYRDMAITPDGSTLFVPDNGSNKINVINTATNTVAAVIDVGQRPCSPAVTPDGHFVYVPNMNSDDVSVINTATNSVDTTITVGDFPTFSTVRPDGAYIYVINENSDNVSVIATATNTVEATIDVGISPRYGLVSDDNLYLYVTNFNSKTVSVISTLNHSILTTINVGDGPRRLTLSPNGNEVYVSNYNGATVSVFTVSVHTVDATINVGGGPGKPIFTPDGATVYVPNWLSNNVSVISTATQSVVETISVGDSPIGGVITPDGKYVYIVNTNGWTVSVIDNGP